VGVVVAGAVALFTIRTWDVSRRFWMLTDQIRDWSIALQPVTALPLVGPPTHVHGYTIGPGFYWLLWLIRVFVGSWFQNLPHGGGIGQAFLFSAVDTLLLVAVWRRTQSFVMALVVFVSLGTASLELSLAAVIWNPIVGLILAEAATALILLGWHNRSLVHVAAVSAIAWLAVHAYTGAIFVTLSVFAAIVVEPCLGGRWLELRRRGAVIVVAVAALQIPWLIHQMATRFQDSGMAAISWSFGEFANQPGARFLASISAYVAACDFLQGTPWHVAALPWFLFACSITVAIRYWQDPVTLSMTLLPQIAAVGGYGLWRGDLQSYYYFSLMPAVVLTVIFAVVGALPPRRSAMIGIAMLAAVASIVPARVRAAATMMRMPEYGVLVAGSREIARRHEPMQSIRTEFPLSPSSDPEFIFGILGGRIERRAAFRAVIRADGSALYLPALQSRR